MRGRILLVLTLIPLAEVWVMVAVARALAAHHGWGVSLGITVGALLATGALGAFLARRQGLAAIRSLHKALERGEFPGRPLLDAALIVAGGALLVMPGYLTDLVGLVLLVPWTRAQVLRRVEGWLRRKVEHGEARVFGTHAPTGAAEIPSSPGRPGEVVIEESFVTGPEPADPSLPPGAADGPRP